AVLRAVAAGKHLMLDAADRLPAYDRPALVVWASGDRVMPPDHGRRLAGLLPLGRLVEIPDSYTLIPLDQPGRLAQNIRDFTSPGTTGQAAQEAAAGPSSALGGWPYLVVPRLPLHPRRVVLHRAAGADHRGDPTGGVASRRVAARGLTG